MRRSAQSTIALVTGWAVLAAAGMLALLVYSLRPGLSAISPASWPSASPIAPASGVANLVLLAHPQCPCSAATIEELDTIMARTQGLLRAHVLFFRPNDAQEGWERTGLWTAAQSIPGVTVTADTDGRAAKAFGARTSGQVLLYDQSLRLAFSGGITSSRGHAGDNTGQQAVISWIRGRSGAPATTPVFGCHLFREDAIERPDATDKMETQ